MLNNKLHYSRKDFFLHATKCIFKGAPFDTYNDELGFGFQNSGSWFGVETTTANLQTNAWYHVTAIYEASMQTVRIYRNGELINTGTVPASLQSNDSVLRIGRNAGSSELFQGRIDEVRIYAEALTEN